jgi:hypothetical protein
MASSHPPHIQRPLSSPQPKAALPLTSLRIATTPVGETLRDLPGTFSALAPHAQLSTTRRVDSSSCPRNGQPSSPAPLLCWLRPYLTLGRTWLSTTRRGGSPSSPLIYVVRTIRAGNRRSASGKMATIGSKTQAEVAVDVDREKQDLKRIWLTDALRKLIATHRLLPSCSLATCLQPEASPEERIDQRAASRPRLASRAPPRFPFRHQRAVNNPTGGRP